MKKLILSLVVAFATFIGAKAQVDLKATLVNPKAQSTVYNQTPFGIDVLVSNLSTTDAVSAADTLYFFFFVDTNWITNGGNLLMIPSTGNSIGAGSEKQIKLPNLTLNLVNLKGLHNFGTFLYYGKDTLNTKNNMTYNPVYFSQWGLTTNTISKFNTEVYPNPSAGEFNITTDLVGDKTIKIYDTQGKLVYSKPFSPSNKTNLPSGVYILMILNSDNKVETRELIIK